MSYGGFFFFKGLFLFRRRSREPQLRMSYGGFRALGLRLRVFLEWL